MTNISLILLNPGSSTLKWAWFRSAFDNEPEFLGALPIEELESLLLKIELDLNTSFGVVRFVHGGHRFFSPTIVTEDVLNQLEKLDELAPLHNPISNRCLRKLMQVINPKIGVVAVFDTEFFKNLPQESQMYGVPRKLREKYSIRRYGFHGFAHSAMYQAWLVLSKDFTNFSDNKNERIVTMQLGSGCSMAAINQGAPIDTTMGFSPNDGLLMATRSGDIDPTLITWLQKKENWTPQEVDNVLNHESGWLGVSGESANMQELLESNNKNAEMAIQLFCYRIRKVLGSYFAIMGGIDGIILSGGISENSIPICQRLLGNLEHLGIDLSDSPNPAGLAIQLSSEQSKVSCYVVANQEFQSMMRSLRQDNQISNLLNGARNVSHC